MGSCFIMNESSIAYLAKLHNENIVRAAINQLSAFSVQLMLEDKVNEDTRCKLGDLVQVLGNTQRELSAVLSEMIEQSKK